MTRLEDLRLNAAVGGVLRDADTMGVSTFRLVTNIFDLESKVITNRNALAVNSELATLAIAPGKLNGWRLQSRSGQPPIGTAPKLAPTRDRPRPNFRIRVDTVWATRGNDQDYLWNTGDGQGARRATLRATTGDGDKRQYAVRR